MRGIQDFLGGNIGLEGFHGSGGGLPTMTGDGVCTNQNWVLVDMEPLTALGFQFQSKSRLVVASAGAASYFILLCWQSQLEIVYAFICLLLFRWAAGRRPAGGPRLGICLLAHVLSHFINA